MGIVIGPFDQLDWKTMLRLKGDLEHMISLKEPVYELAIKNQKKTLRKYLRREAA